MRLFAILPLTLAACQAQSPQSQADAVVKQQVEAVLKQLERAEQTGDFNAWVGLWTREKSLELESLRAHARARPEVHYRPTKTYVQRDEAVILVQAAADSFAVMTLRREGGQWKMAGQLWKNTAPDANSVYAFLLPAPGAFTRAGSPWDQIAPAMDSGQAARLGWQMKAAFDEAYLYIRFESNAELPAPGSTIEKPPGGWPVLKIGAKTGGADAGEFVLYDAVDVGDQATFDPSGKANSHRAFAAYTIRLERNGREIFSTTAGLNPSPLLDVAGRDYDIRIPLATMGIMNSRAIAFTIGDAQWPKSALLSVAAQRYPR